jgi:hypothetical protein
MELMMSGFSLYRFEENKIAEEWGLLGSIRIFQLIKVDPMKPIREEVKHQKIKKDSNDGRA